MSLNSDACSVGALVGELLRRISITREPEQAQEDEPQIQMSYPFARRITWDTTNGGRLVVSTVSVENFLKDATG